MGPGSWSADVFGTGLKSTVDYTVGKAADGSPTLALGAIVAADGITVDAGTPVTKSDEDHGASASVRIAFSRDGYTKKLTIRVSVDGEGDHHASLELKLSGMDRQKTTGALADLVGTHTWSGKLCDGTAVGISYDVLADGTVAYGSATGGTATAKTGEHGFTARFDGTKVRVSVSLKQAEDGSYSLKTSAKRSGCLKQTVPSPPSTPRSSPALTSRPTTRAASPATTRPRDPGDKKSGESDDHKGDGSGDKSHD